MARIGFYGGCFNPPTKAHIILAKKAIEECELEKVIFVPVGDLYQKEKLEKGTHRCAMLKIACKDENRLEVSDIEVKDNKLYKAIDIFTLLKKLYKEDEIFFLMGADNLERLPLWTDCDILIRDFKYIVFDRGEDSVERILGNNNFFKGYEKKFTIIKNKQYTNCSSTNIREQIKNNITPDGINEEVYEYIRKNNLYSLEIF